MYISGATIFYGALKQESKTDFRLGNRVLVGAIIPNWGKRASHNYNNIILLTVIFRYGNRSMEIRKGHIGTIIPTLKIYIFAQNNLM